MHPLLRGKEKRGKRKAEKKLCGLGMKHNFALPWLKDCGEKVESESLRIERRILEVGGAGVLGY